MIFEKPEWEHVFELTHRMKVPGGWIVFINGTNPKQSGAMCYVPDPGHAWQWTKEVSEQEGEIYGSNCGFFYRGKTCEGKSGFTCLKCIAYRPEKEDEKT